MEHERIITLLWLYMKAGIGEVENRVGVFESHYFIFLIFYTTDLLKKFNLVSGGPWERPPYPYESKPEPWRREMHVNTDTFDNPIW